MAKRKNPGKGSNFERRTAKQLSLWLTDGERDDCIWRTAQSGGRATQRAKSNLKTAGSYGDLCSTHESTKEFFSNFCLELKKGYSSTNPLDIIDSKQKEPELIKFWNQCEKSRKDGNRKFSLLIIERNNRKPVVVLSRNLISLLDAFYGEPDYLIDCIRFTKGELDLHIMKLEDFLTWITCWDDDFFGDW